MSIILAILAGLMMAGAVYTMMDRNLVKYLFGLVLLNHVANLILFDAGRLTEGSPPFVPPGLSEPVAGTANPLPQAMILTAIVISFGILAFSLVLGYRAYIETGHVDREKIGPAPPEDGKDEPEEKRDGDGQ